MKIEIFQFLAVGQSTMKLFLQIFESFLINQTFNLIKNIEQLTNSTNYKLFVIFGFIQEN